MFIMQIKQNYIQILYQCAYIWFLKVYSSIFVLDTLRHIYVYYNTDHPHSQIGLWSIQEEAVIMNNAAVSSLTRWTIWLHEIIYFIANSLERSSIVDLAVTDIYVGRMISAIEHRPAEIIILHRKWQPSLYVCQRLGFNRKMATILVVFAIIWRFILLWIMTKLYIKYMYGLTCFASMCWCYHFVI